jgi:hypothetical protein
MTIIAIPTPRFVCHLLRINVRDRITIEPIRNMKAKSRSFDKTLILPILFQFVFEIII